LLLRTVSAREGNHGFSTAAIIRDEMHERAALVVTEDPQPAHRPSQVTFADPFDPANYKLLGMSRA
jgi:hypothetical protein